MEALLFHSKIHRIMGRKISRKSPWIFRAGISMDRYTVKIRQISSHQELSQIL